jgi:hypothetical protein
MLGLLLSAAALTLLFRGQSSRVPGASILPGASVVAVGKSPAFVGSVQHRISTAPRLADLPAEATVLIEEVLRLRAIPFHQARGWTNRLAMESALRGLKDLGIQAADLPPGVLDDPLDFLPADRRSQVEPQIADVTRQINQLDYDLLGEAWQDKDVDTIKALWNEQYEALAANLTPDELREWTARHSWEAQLLRELPMELSPEEFTTAAAAEFQFARHAQDLDYSTGDGRDKLRLRYADRERILRETLGSDERMAEYDRTSAPGYAAMQEAAQSQGLSRDDADYLWELSRWTEVASGMVSPEHPPEVAAATLGQIRDQLRGAIAGTLNSPPAWLEELLPALKEPAVDEALPSIPTPAPDPLNAPLP